MKKPAYIASAILMMTGLLFAQTSDEKQKLASLGKGFVIYAEYAGAADKEGFKLCFFQPEKSSIWRYDLDGSGTPAPRKIVQRGVFPTVSRDGSLLAWLDWQSPKSCDIYVGDTEGGNRRKLASLPYAGFLEWNESDQLIVATGDRSGRDYGNFAGKMARVRMDGNVTIIADKSKYTSDWFYYNDMDMHGNWVISRWNAAVSIGRWGGEENRFWPKQVAKQGCGMTFSPSGKRFIINDVPHTGISHWSLENEEWVKKSTATIWPFKVDDYRWSNDEKWIAATGESDLFDAFALNADTHKPVRLTFSTDKIEANANLFLGTPKPVQPLRIRAFSSSDKASTKVPTNPGQSPRDLLGRSTGAFILFPENDREHNGRLYYE